MKRIVLLWSVAIYSVFSVTAKKRKCTIIQLGDISNSSFLVVPCCIMLPSTGAKIEQDLMALVTRLENMSQRRRRGKCLQVISLREKHTVKEETPQNVKSLTRNGEGQLGCTL